MVEYLNLADKRIIPHRKRILIIGSTGQVGSMFFHTITKNYPEFIVIGTTHNLKKPQRLSFDLESDAMDPLKMKLLLDACSPHVIIIAAAFTNANLCESQTEKKTQGGKAEKYLWSPWDDKITNTVNCEAVAHIGKLGKERNIKIVNFSSDYVFNSPNPENFPNYINTTEKDIGLREDSSTNPPNYYGLSKVKSEKALLCEVPTSLIIRTSRIFGPEEVKKNFVNQVVRNLSTGKEMSLLSDELSCPTYNKDLCEAVMLLIKKDCSGIYHIVGPEVMSKYQWGLKIAEYFKLDSKWLIPKSSDELKLPAPRGKFTALSTHKFRTEFPDFKFKTLEEALNEWKKSKDQFPVADC
ncbi:rfbD [Acanthosepion pharaonis]|uniref:Methionine adenosyltransferase 2 subunit beta n=1 Tax=Acanthosepion pharaonis TaxID=158019 RepID=A0A812DL58_ACAPH|nr:rfbD [Sepia pharaonis]